MNKRLGSHYFRIRATVGAREGRFYLGCRFYRYLELVDAQQDGLAYIGSCKFSLIGGGGDGELRQLESTHAS